MPPCPPRGPPRRYRYVYQVRTAHGDVISQVSYHNNENYTDSTLILRLFHSALHPSLEKDGSQRNQTVSVAISLCFMRW